MVKFASTGQWIYLDGKMVPESEAKLHILTGAVKYGATVFEGICAYRNPSDGQLNVFRLREHLDRLQYSMRVMRFAKRWSNDEMTKIVLDVLRKNEQHADSHIRLSAYSTGMGYLDSVDDVALGCLSVNRHEKSLADKAIKAQVSSWRRIDDASMPPRIKAAANYHNGRLATLQARHDGYDEVIFLTPNGKVAESAGACLIAVRNGRVITPRVTHGILESITRETMIDLMSKQLGLPVEEREIDRSELYACEEVFLTGSGYEVTPIINVDGFVIGDGKVGAHTQKTWEVYEQAVRGQLAGHDAWLTPVWPAAKANAAE